MNETYIVSRQDTVCKLETTGDEEEGHEGVDELRTLRRRLLVVLKDVAGNHIYLAGGAAAAAARGGCAWSSWASGCRGLLGSHCV